MKDNSTNEGKGHYIVTGSFMAAENQETNMLI